MELVLLQEMVQSFSEWLTWVMAGGSAAVASMILENLNWFQSQNKEKKQFIAYATSSIIALVAMALVSFAPDFVMMMEPYFKLLAGVMGTIFGMKLFHNSMKEKQG